MTDPVTPQNTVDSLLSGRSQSQRSLRPALKAASFLADEAVDSSAVQAPRRFSPFAMEDLQEAVQLASRLMEITDREGLGAAMAEIQRERGTRASGLVQHATKLFITHHPVARESLRIPPLEQRHPDLARPSAMLAAADASGVCAGEPAGATAPEDRLDYWREDPLINEHHEHWHLVYPAAGRPSPRGAGGVQKLGDRHGELFAYMHQQMLARYDAERLAAGLERVEPFSDFSGAIPQGYCPGELRLWDGDTWYVFRGRPAGVSLSDLDPDGPFARRRGAKLSELSRFRDLLVEAAKSSRFTGLDGRPVDASTLGDTVEANIGAVDFSRKPEENHAVYGNLHNDGHIHFMSWDNASVGGVMGSTTAAVRDPIFWRWHKEIDRIFESWQETQPPYDLHLPDVRIRKSPVQDGSAGSPDIILCLWDDLPPTFQGAQRGTEAYGEKLGAELFGYSGQQDRDHWDDDFSQKTISLPGEGDVTPTVTTTGELLTEMRKRVVEVFDEENLPFDQVVEFVSHRDFYYFLRVENTSPEPRIVTVRIFLAPEEDGSGKPVWDDRTTWIEMDRFSYELLGNERAVISRPSDLSAVIRKPALRPADLSASDQPSPNRESQPWCDCGWPYTLLLPRGTGDGMKFRLFVMLSDGDDLRVPPQPGKCSSISYCGLQDQVYPDRYMGYPFSRPFRDGIAAAVEACDNVAWRSITIRCRNLPPS